ncbi:MAG: diguanylate cyclase [Thermoleophilia bacterium]|jgi:diguanylate cyclase (GGDEF)-like protein|nr:diguanylate cyclase [Thermoleophilia bacterium]
MTTAANAGGRGDRGGIDGLPVPAALHTADGSLVAVNPLLTGLIGWEEHEVVGPGPLGPALDPAAWARWWVARARGGPGHVDLALRHRDGHVVWSEQAAMPGPGGRVVVLHRDTGAEHRERVLAEAGSALRAGAPPAEVLQILAHETARLLGADRGEVALAGDLPEGLAGPGAGGGRLPSVASVPIRVGPRLKGTLTVASGRRGAFSPTTTATLGYLATVAGAVVDAAVCRIELGRDGIDPLTRLPTHHALHERLDREVAGARRSKAPLSLVSIDLDHFGLVNDSLGHRAADGVLLQVAGVMAARAAGRGMLARVGGDEFALLLPGAGAGQAVALMDGLRAELADLILPRGVRITVSAGVCELARAEGAEGLRHLADGAMRWAKAQGRDRVVAHHPHLAAELDAERRARRREHARTLAGLGALARAVDAKDPATRRHSERVGDLAVRLAERLGWGPGEALRLREAALLHDVGKIGVPDRILFKAGPLAPEEYLAVQAHAALGAEIVEGILAADQVAWIRHHHERWDGTGYPDRLTGEATPQGAAIIAVADAWDVMTAARSYSPPLAADLALAECRRGAGSQFDPEVVRALEEERTAAREEGRG